MQNAKEEVTALLNLLPDNCSLENIQHHLYVIEKIKKGLEEVNNGDTLSHIY